MVGDRIDNLIHNLRRAAADGPAVPDAQLLERFAEAGDEAAFELLARRHGPMVLGVCRRVLGDAHEAEDAFQATFLVLARKAESLTRHRSVGGWLHTVASRVAQRARARRAARTARERSLNEPPADALDPASEVAWREVRQVIDEEVSQLPERYRAPFVLYHLEGYSAVEVARELGCPVGTAESWLTRARERLRARLARRGVTPASGLLVALASQQGWLPQAVAREAQAAAAAGRGVAGAVSAEAAALAGEVVRGLGTATATVAVLLLATATVASVGLAAREHPRARPEAPEAVRRDEALSANGRRKPAGAAPASLRRPFAGGHFSGINAVALSPDGLTLASAGDDAQVKLWDVASGRERATLRRAAPARIPKEQLWAHEWQVQAVAFSPDGKTLASGSNDRTVKLWDVATGKEKATLRGHTLFVYSVAFSPDGKALAWAGGAQPAALDTTIRWDFKDVPKDPRLFKESGEVKVWDLATGKERTFFRGDAGRVTSVTFSPDGKILASGGRDGRVRLWDVAAGRERACLWENALCVNAVAFSPDGKSLASVQAEQGDKVKIWDLASGRVRARLKGHRGWVFAVAFSPDGRALATAGNVPRDPRQGQDASGEVRLWDAATGRQLGAPLTFRHRASSLAFGARGKILAVGGQYGTGSGEITLWDLSPGSGSRDQKGLP